MSFNFPSLVSNASTLSKLRQLEDCFSRTIIGPSCGSDLLLLSDILVLFSIISEGGSSHAMRAALPKFLIILSEDSKHSMLCLAFVTLYILFLPRILLLLPLDSINILCTTWALLLALP